MFDVQNVEEAEAGTELREQSRSERGRVKSACASQGHTSGSESEHILKLQAGPAGIYYRIQCMKIYSVSEFRQEVNELLEQVTVAIEGEVTEFHISQNRFVWFSIADEQTVIKCFMLSFQLRIPLEDGMQVRVVGSPTLFKKGQFVFRPRAIELVGDGTLRKAYELLKKKLDAEGLFDEGRKRSLPRFPHTIGLVTSSDAAAYTDVLRILKNRWAGLEIRHINVNVQGARAVTSIVHALQQLNEEEKDLDCIILTRGGGSLEDLQAFNSEEVVRAIFASNIPVVCGVGHERDITLADLVADVRASTPSNAAERVVPHKDDVVAELTHLLSIGEHKIQQYIQEHKDHIDNAVHMLDQYARSQVLQFRELEQRLQFALQEFRSSLILQKEKIQHAAQLLQSFNPQHVLERGYTITMDQSGKVLSRKTQIRSGQHMLTRFSDGSVQSIVQKKQSKN